MPIFDFYCPECGHKELNVWLNHRKIRFCEVCKEQMRNAWSPPALKRDGTYSYGVKKEEKRDDSN